MKDGTFLLKQGNLTMPLPEGTTLDTAVQAATAHAALAAEGLNDLPTRVRVLCYQEHMQVEGQPLRYLEVQIIDAPKED